jgi:hypothetical protein
MLLLPVLLLFVVAAAADAAVPAAASVAAVTAALSIAAAAAAASAAAAVMYWWLLMIHHHRMPSACRSPQLMLACGQLLAFSNIHAFECSQCCILSRQHRRQNSTSSWRMHCQCHLNKA